MTKKDDNKPMPPDVEKIRQAAKEGRITFADQFKIDEYPDELGKILDVVGIKGGWFSDESTIGDLMLNEAELEQLSTLCKMEVTHRTYLWEACEGIRRKPS